MIRDCINCSAAFDERLDKDNTHLCLDCQRHRFISASEFRDRIAAALGYRWPLFPHIFWPKKELDSQQLDMWSERLIGMRRDRRGLWKRVERLQR